MKKIIFMAAFMTVAMMLNACGQSEVAEEVTVDESNTVDEMSAVSEETQESSSDYVYVGDTFYSGIFQYTITGYDANCMGYKSYAEPKDGYKYIRVEVSIKNVTSNKTGNYTSSCFTCYADNVKADEAYYNDFDAEDGLAYGNLSPSRCVTGALYYEVPSDCNSVEIEYSTEQGSDEIIVIKCETDSDNSVENMVDDVETSAYVGKWRMNQYIYTDGNSDKYYPAVLELNEDMTFSFDYVDTDNYEIQHDEGEWLEESGYIYLDYLEGYLAGEQVDLFVKEEEGITELICDSETLVPEEYCQIIGEDKLFVEEDYADYTAENTETSAYVGKWCTNQYIYTDGNSDKYYPMVLELKEDMTFLLDFVNEDYYEIEHDEGTWFEENGFIYLDCLEGYTVGEQTELSVEEEEGITVLNYGIGLLIPEEYFESIGEANLFSEEEYAWYLENSTE